MQRVVTLQSLSLLQINHETVVRGIDVHKTLRLKVTVQQCTTCTVISGYDGHDATKLAIAVSSQTRGVYRLHVDNYALGGLLTVFPGQKVEIHGDASPTGQLALYDGNFHVLSHGSLSLHDVNVGGMVTSESDGQFNSNSHVQTWLDGTLTSMQTKMQSRLATISSTMQAELGVAAPYGSIVLWHGSEKDIPTGWVACDGQHGTPDLRDRFVVGAGSRYPVGNNAKKGVQVGANYKWVHGLCHCSRVSLHLIGCCRYWV